MNRSVASVQNYWWEMCVWVAGGSQSHGIVQKARLTPLVTGFNVYLQIYVNATVTKVYSVDEIAEIACFVCVLWVVENGLMG